MMKEQLRTETDPKKQAVIYDDYLGQLYIDKNTKVDPLANRPEYERKCMAQLILQHEGQNLVIKSKKQHIEKAMEQYIQRAMVKKIKIDEKEVQRKE